MIIREKSGTEARNRIGPLRILAAMAALGGSGMMAMMCRFWIKNLFDDSQPQIPEVCIGFGFITLAAAVALVVMAYQILKGEM